MDYDFERSDFPIYRGIRNQKGYGLGGVFRKLFRFIIPIIKQHSVPILRSVGESALKGATNFASDTLAGQNIKDSANRRLMETLNELKDKAGMKGSGINKRKFQDDFGYSKKKKKLTRNIKKTKRRKKDIFD